MTSEALRHRLAQQIVAWPSVPLPRVHVVFGLQNPEVRNGAVISGGGGLKVIDPIDPELFLAVTRLDLNDDRACAAFIDRHGMLTGGFSETCGSDAIAGELEYEFENVLAALRPFYVDRFGEEDGAPYAEELQGQTLLEFRHAAGCIRDLVRSWRWLFEGVVPQRWESRVWSKCPDLRPRDKLDAAALLCSELTAGISSANPRLDLVLKNWRRRIEKLHGASTPLRLESVEPAPEDAGAILAIERRLSAYGGGPGYVSAYATCCLQLFNAVVENATVLVCSRPGCGDLYIRGSRRDGRPRTRIGDYCSDRCADLARKRKQREEARRRRPPAGPSAA